LNLKGNQDRIQGISKEIFNTLKEMKAQSFIQLTYLDEMEKLIG
jgi:hypothetical protein